MSTPADRLHHLRQVQQPPDRAYYPPEFWDVPELTLRGAIRDLWARHHDFVLSSVLMLAFVSLLLWGVMAL